MARERWRNVKRASGYQVSDRGRVRSVARTLSDGRTAGGVMLKQFPDDDGYLRVSLGKRYARVHQLVLEAFVGPKPDSMECCHDNGDRTCNVLSNLRWDTHEGNERDRKRHRELKRNGTHRPVAIETSRTNGAAGG